MLTQRKFMLQKALNNLLGHSMTGETAADLFFFLPTTMASCRHKQSKEIPKGADAKPVSLSTWPVTVTRN